jgi:hypothetical protein
MKKVIILFVFHYCFCCNGQNIEILDGLGKRFEKGVIVFKALDFDNYTFVFGAKDYIQILEKFCKQNEKFNKKSKQQFSCKNDLFIEEISAFMTNHVHEGFTLLEDKFVHVFPSKCILAKLLKQKKAFIIDNSSNQIVLTKIITSCQFFI